MIQTPQTRVLFGHTLRRLALGVFAVIIAIFVIASVIPYNTPLKTQHTDAASAKTMNFQARLLNSAGAIVPDGTYNIEFKLYNSATVVPTPDQGACTRNSGTPEATCLWTETRTGGNKVTVRAGYVSVYLGSVTDLPSNIWNQQLWLTMNIGGTGSPSWDGEMSPRLQLTAVPAAYSLTNYNSATGFSSSLSLSGSTGGDQTFTVPDQGAGGSYTLLTTTAANSSFVQFGPGSVQVDGGTNNSIFINKTGGSGNIFELQKTASDVFVVGNTGNITATGLYNTNTFTGSALQFGTASTATIQSAASQSLNVTGHNNSVFSTDAGTVTLQGFWRRHCSYTQRHWRY